MTYKSSYLYSYMIVYLMLALLSALRLFVIGRVEGLFTRHCISGQVLRVHYTAHASTKYAFFSFVKVEFGSKPNKVANKSNHQYTL